MKSIWLILCLLFAFSCDDKENSNGTYKYTAYFGKSLAVCASGFIEMTIAIDSTITGSWEISAANEFSEKEIGPQIGTGKLEGSIKAGKIFINLNPGWADNNIFLNADYSKDQFKGSWLWSTFIGPSASGSFGIK
jgi:hypothetical protein